MGGAPSMMLHMLPHILDYDPHSGDFGLGFFGHTLEAGAYFVQHADLGAICFLCDITTNNDNLSLVFSPRDSYRQRVYVEPLGLYLQLDTGSFKSIAINSLSHTLQIEFDDVAAVDSTFNIRRLRINKEGLN